jgi:GNAT superfamily N-acetyltransferase
LATHKSVRVARESDASDVASLTAQLGYQVTPDEVTSRLSRILRRSDQRFIVAEDQQRIVGWVHALVVEYVEANPFAVIGGLVVDKSSRRRGIGRMLMEYAETWAKEQRCSIVRLWSSAGRTGAHQFYERQGYKNIKTQYSFVKPLDPGGERELSQFIPRIDTEMMEE